MSRSKPQRPVEQARPEAEAGLALDRAPCGHIHMTFRSVDEMNAALVARWNERVADADVVWVLGDVAMGQIASSLPLARRLNGTKHLIAGNHDRCWAGHGPKAAKAEQMYRDAGFTTISEGLPPGYALEVAEPSLEEG